MLRQNWRLDRLAIRLTTRLEALLILFFRAFVLELVVTNDHSGGRSSQIFGCLVSIEPLRCVVVVHDDGLPIVIHLLVRLIRY